MIRIEVNIDWSGLEEGLQKLVDMGKDLTPLTRNISEIMMDSSQRAFMHEQSPTGEAWAALSPVTIALRKGQGKILQPSGGRAGLLASLQAEATRDTARVGTNKIYASTHQFGAKQRQYQGKAPWGDVPARPFLGIGPEDEEEIRDAIRTAIHKAMYD